MINDIIEKEFQYINEELFEFSNDRETTHDTIISVETFIYGSKVKLPKNFGKNIRKIRKSIENNTNEYSEVIKEMDELIKNSVVNKNDFVVYRGIDKQINLKIRDILEDKCFMYTSLQKDYANMFKNNTEDCYNGSLKDIKKSNGTLFKINVPIGNKFLERTSPYYFCCYFLGGGSEIIFPRNTKMIVKNINDEYVETEIIN